jgi:hypothetical protein
LSSVARIQSCQAQCLYIRAFSTSSTRSKIGPESPRFIEIPRPPQRNAPRKQTIKGTLPPPRNLFPNSAGDKTSNEYLASATREPTAHHQLCPPESEYIAWKRRLAATRRQNLREGILALHRRKVRSEKAIAIRSAIKRENRERRLHAPQREDERLTAPTITAAMRKLQLGNLADPDREARIAAASAHVAAKAKMLEEQRRDALHTLYMHARNFITTEAQLDAAIEKVFVDRPWSNVPGKENAVSIWDAEGAPQTVQDLLGDVNKTQRSALMFHRGPAVATGKRMLKIAEELTGGKMD